MTLTENWERRSTGGRDRRLLPVSPVAPEPLPSQLSKNPWLQPPSSRPKTLPLEQQKTYDHSQCWLLTKLSAEIRLMIWESAIGRLKLHIGVDGKKLRHSVCGDTCRACFFHETLRKYNSDHFPVSWYRPESGLLSLLRTCTQVYSETISILYTSNTFVFMNLDTMPTLQFSISPRHWDIIRSLEVRWEWIGIPEFPSHEEAIFSGQRDCDKEVWEDGCWTLKMMKALRHFTLVSEAHWMVRWPGATWKILEPLKELRLQGGWELRVPGSEQLLKLLDTNLKGAGFDCFVRPLQNRARFR